MAVPHVPQIGMLPAVTMGFSNPLPLLGAGRDPGIEDCPGPGIIPEGAEIPVQGGLI